MDIGTEANEAAPTAPSEDLTIRLYRDDTDHAAMAEICMLTAANGGDARPLYPDQGLIPDIFAFPYTVSDPELCFVAEAGGRAVGYIVGTADTPRYARWFRAQWLPQVAGLHRQPPERVDWERDPEGAMSSLMHHPERMLVPELVDYPAHLHIDLMPGFQGKGGGRALMTAFLAAAHRAGAPKVHLAMSRTNFPAQAFYRRLGFTELTVPPEPDGGGPLYLGRPTG